MLLRPSNTLLLDEPTNHLDLDSKEVLLDALVDYGGTLVFVSHDRYFVERLATRIVEVGSGEATSYPGTYAEFLWHKNQGNLAKELAPSPRAAKKAGKGRVGPGQARQVPSREAKKRADAETRRQARAVAARRQKIDEIETRIAECEREMRDLEAAMAAPGFYTDRSQAQPVVNRHQSLMWLVGDLMHEWEQLQTGQSAEG